MLILNSIIFGSEGTYKLFEISLNFINKPVDFSASPGVNPPDFISYVLRRCIENQVFQWITQARAHAFVHEISHALANRCLKGRSTDVNVYPNGCEAFDPTPTTNQERPSDWGETVIDMAGPMGSIAFSTCKLLTAIALKRRLSCPAAPVALTLGGGAVIWMAGELLHTYVSFLNQGKGTCSIGCIQQRGKAHLSFAIIALISQYALGIFAAVQCAGYGPL